MAATKSHDPIKLLKDDHEKVKALFDKFESSRSESTKKGIAKEAMVELDIHADIEETIFYPAFEEWAKSKTDEDIVLEAEEEHHVVHVLIAELKKLPEDDEHWDAKFTVLSENVRHHIEEERGDASQGSQNGRRKALRTRRPDVRAQARARKEDEGAGRVPCALTRVRAQSGGRAT